MHNSGLGVTRVTFHHRMKVLPAKWCARCGEMFVPREATHKRCKECWFRRTGGPLKAIRERHARLWGQP